MGQLSKIVEVKRIIYDNDNMPVFFDKSLIGAVQSQLLVYEYVFENNFIDGKNPRLKSLAEFWEAKQARYLAIIRYLTDNKNLTVLDIGCGRGEFLRILRNDGWKNISGIDIHPKSLSLSQRYAPVKSLDMHFCKELGQHDIIWASNILQHSYNPELLMENLWKITGKFLYIELPIQTFDMAVRPFEGHVFYCDNPDCLIGYVYKTLPYITEVIYHSDDKPSVFSVGMILRK